MSARGERESMKPLSVEPTASRPAGFFLVFLMLGLSFSPLISTVSATPSSITTFSGGNSTETVLGNTTVDIALERNTTIMESSFELRYLSSNPSPGIVQMDIGNDSLLEWSFGGNRYGELGSQTRFSTNGSTTSSTPTQNTWSPIWSFDLPSEADVDMAELNVSYAPVMGGGMVATGGSIDDMAVADVDNDGEAEVVILDRDKDPGNGSHPHVGIIDWTLTSGFSAISWVWTCAGGTELMTGDANSDSRVDVYLVDEQNGSVCLHLANSTGFAPFTNISLTSPGSLGDVYVDDIDADGYSDLIYSTSNGNLCSTLRRSGGYSTLFVNVTVPSNSSGMGGPGGTSTTISDILSVNLWSGVKTAAVAEDMEGYVSFWNFSTNQQGGFAWVISMINATDLEDNIQAVDIDGDGDDDLFGDAPMSGTTMSVFTAAGGYQSTQSMGFFANEPVFADWDGSGTMTALLIDSGTSDGSDVTFTGDIAVHSVSASGIASSSTPLIELEPITAPTRMIVEDIDGDGVPEHIVAGGEATNSIFIAGHHNLLVDFDGDTTAEVNISGYAGNGSQGIDVIEWMDTMGSLPGVIQSELTASTPSITDFYGIDHYTLQPDAYVRGEGNVLGSELLVTYSLTARVDTNPGLGNLTNALNREMVAGTGPFDVGLVFNMSSSTGQFTLQNLAITHIPGATSIDLPTEPILIQMNISEEMSAQLQAPFIAFEWNNTSSDDESTFMMYEIHRTKDNSPLNLMTPYSTSQGSFFMDQSLQPGTYRYYVRAMHQNGVNSNLSSPLQVTIDPPPPDTTPPDPVTNLTVSDVPGDEGGHLVISWDDGGSDDLHHHLIFVDMVQFTNASTRVPVANLTAGNTSVVVNMTSDVLDNTGGVQQSGVTIMDNVDHYVAVVAVDTLGNLNETVVIVGPVRALNNSNIISSISIDVLESTVARGDPLTISGVLDLETESASGRTVQIDFSDDVHSTQVVAVTDTTGAFSVAYTDWSDLLDSTSRFVGVVNVSATYAGGSTSTQQVILGSSATSSFESIMIAAVSAVESSVQLDSDNQGKARLQVTTDSRDLSLLGAISFDWTLGNATESIVSSTGTSTLDQTGFIEEEIDYPGGGEIEFVYDTNSRPFWLVLSPSSVSIDLLPPPVQSDTVEDTNVTEPTPDPSLLALNVDCGDQTWSMGVNTSLWSTDNANHLECTVTNPNENIVYVDLELEMNVIGVEIESDLGGSFSIQGGEDQILVLEMQDNTQFRDGSVDLSLTASAPDYQDSLTTLTIQFQFIDETINPAGPSDASEGGASGNNNLVLIGGIVAVILLLGVVVAIMLRSGNDEDDEDLFSDGDDVGSLPMAVSGGAKATREEADIPKGVPLDELMKQGSRPAPVSMSKSKKPSIVNTEPEEESEIEEEMSSDEIEDEPSEDDYTDSDNYHVDDDGTEWWKDELDVWWWRGPDDEDWSEYTE